MPGGDEPTVAAPLALPATGFPPSGARCCSDPGRSVGRTHWSLLTYYACRTGRGVCESGSGPGLRRPVVIVQGESLNRSRIATAVCVPLTTNLRWAEAPGNVLLPARISGLAKDSVANSSQLVTVDRAFLSERVGKLPAKSLAQIMSGIDIILGR
ncbi:MAG TPA: type II toxin-antitoxin system PemK/MazF family toxin [Acidobacteriota bacterium]